jgi:poly-gamma-glutamate capsule biosynthesis protein CapA/YwtB (metallophosphatase superfamily)
MLSRGVGAKMESEKDWTYPFQKVAATLAAADLTFGNLEGPVSDVGRNRHHLYSFRADPKAIEGLKLAGFDVMSLANNHTYDWDPPALLDTLRRLRESGIAPVGAGANDLEAHYPQLVNLAGLKLAFLAYVNVEPKAAIAAPDKPGVAWLELDRVLADIRFARPLADLVVVGLHWGNEYASQPQRSQVALAHQMIDAGADLVVGGHPHAVQPLEQYRGRWIAYSLGNFVFDQRAPGTRRGAMLKVDLTDKQITEVTLVPITIAGTFQAILTPPEELAREALRAGRNSKARAVRAQ